MKKTQGGLSGLAAWTLACAVALSVTGCGGGGGGTTTPPPVVEPSIPDAITQAAGKAELRAYSTPSANKAELKWTDLVEGETGFRIDKSINGAWTQVATLPANATQPWGMGWTGTLDAAATSYRVVALLAGGKEVALKSPAGLSELKLGPAPAAAAIALSMAEPLKGEVKLSIAGAPDAQSAGFYVDLSPNPLPISGTKPSFETTWNTAPESNGSHKIRSLLQYAPDTFVEIERAVTLGNPDLSATVVGFIGAQSPQAQVYVVPKSKSDTPTVSASLSVDGKSVGTRTTTDCYYANVNSSCVPAYLFTLKSADYDYGPHTLAAKVLDAKGTEAQATGTMTKAIPLAVTLTSPTTSRFTGPKVQIRGEVTGDPAKSVYVAVDFSGQILQERNSYGPISADFDLTGLPDATYFLTVTARSPDGTSTAATRLVFWQANPPMSYEWVKDVDSGLLASGRDGVLLRNGDLTEWLKPNGAAVTLAGGNPNYPDFKYANGQWVGRTFGLETGLYAWAADGTRRTLSVPSVASFATAGNKVGWLQAVGGKATLMLSDLTTIAPVAVPLSGDPTKLSGQYVSLGTTSGGTTIAAYEERMLDAQGNYSGAGAVFVYDAASNQHRQLSDAATVASSPVTDGKQIAWMSAPSPSDTPHDLWVAPVDASSAPQRLSTMLKAQPQWVDGLLVWTEDAGVGSNSIKVYRNGTVTTLLTQFQAQLLAVGSGSVAYTGGKRLLVWSPDKGERLVHGLFEGQGYGSVAIADGWLYFTIGSALYRVPL